MKNAMELRTRKASGVFGRLIRQWTLEFDTDLPHRREPDGRLVIAAEVLRNILAEADLVEGDADGEDGDYHIRSDIEEIDLIPRQPGRFSVLMPEKDVLRALRAEESGHLRMAAVYAEVDPAKPDLDLAQLRPADSDLRPATYTVTFDGDDKFRKFLDPYMASYMCTQCL